MADKATAKPLKDDDRVVIQLDHETAPRGLLKVDPDAEPVAKPSGESASEQH
jgi:hypothetical protein